MSTLGEKLDAEQVRDRAYLRRYLSRMEAELSDLDSAGINSFDLVFETLIQMVYEVNRINGWHDDRSFGDDIALMHSEVSEMLEGYRHGNPPSEHVPEYSAIEEEMADLLIRMLDMMGRRRTVFGNVRFGKVLLAKMLFNAERGYRHGGKRL